MRFRPVVFAFLAASTVASCIGGPGNAGVAWLRNESPETVAISIEQTSHAGLSGVFGGTDRQAHAIPTWQEGWCNAAGYGINAGPLTIEVTGELVPFPISTTIEVPETPQTQISVTVDSSGEVHFAATAPTSAAPCSNYPEAVPSSRPQ